MARRANIRGCTHEKWSVSGALSLLLVMVSMMRLHHVTAVDSNETTTTLTAFEAIPSTTMRMPAGYSQSCFNWTSMPEAAGGNCSRLSRNGFLKCYGGMNNLGALAKLGKPLPAQQMLLCGWPLDATRFLGELQKLPRLRALTIEYSGFTEFTFDFPEMAYLQSINISWTNLSYISARTFKRVHTLKVLDLRWNQLIQLDGPLLLPRSFEQLYLAGNPWNCTRNFKWLLLQPEKGRLVVDRDELLCTDRKYKERQMLLVMHYKLELKKECQSHPDLRNCTCLMHHILPKTHIPLYTVNCSHMQFHSLPAYLPENTTTLTINDNLISDINPLRDNPHYRHVVDVHLENNRISNVDDLENTFWLQNFRLFNLRGNNLRKLHVYALDNALNDNENANLLLLSKNPWHCTCKFGMRLRELLNKYRDIVRDAWNVTCTYMQEDELRLAKVLSLSRQDMCNVSAESGSQIHPIDWLNGVLASLILLILGKLAYDYYHYKYYNRVPWIVMKMP
ncbi:protein singed wings 2 [Drosophila guanche]|uniref:Blast:Protein singed wings 2 n=1 Tax=Drosophila guanche TaxID=7266 RepID=A0A3B0IZ72_DROGU|nr:protein singed wings 2 [Drosophila guanche]SPP73267.1 blast:Protein singed wings 2 [Drosophila guanche]